MPVKRRAATPPVDTMSAKKIKAEERDERAERRSAIRDQAQHLHDREPRDQNGRLKHFPFLRLPAELRNAIYKHVFRGTRYKFDTYREEDDLLTPDKSFDECNLGLLATSRQVHAETHLLPYKLASFHFEFYCSDETPEEECTCGMTDFEYMRTKEQRDAFNSNRRVSFSKWV